MANPTCGAKFVSQKINKIRWQPTSKQAVQQSTTFASGSWDNGGENRVCVWQLDTNSGIEGGPREPTLICEAEHRGDVSDLQYVDQEQMLVASSLGFVSIYKFHPNSQTLSCAQNWSDLHKHTASPCSCTGLALRPDGLFVSVGEDGKLNIISLTHTEPTRVFDEVDSCTVNAVKFLRHSEVATVNTIGQLKVWDIRQASQRPSQVFMLTGERVPLHCVDRHPSQPHVVATGGQDGTLCIWDTRQDKFPVTLLSAHSTDMWELKFHPRYPDNLFSCSEDGSVWHWDRSGSHSGHSEAGRLQNVMSDPSAASPWLSSEASKQGLNITDLLPGNTMSVNTLDILDYTLLCGTDGELICTIPDLVIK